MCTFKRLEWSAAAVVVTLSFASTARSEISADRIRAHTAVLSSDEFEGRGPGTKGEEKTVAYLEEQFKSSGLKPGNPDGTYVQEVPLVGLTTNVTTTFKAGDETLQPVPVNDYSAVSRRVTPTVEVKDSDLVFVGYGVVAPEYGWDDYKGVNVRGKTVIMLINDPPIPDANQPGRLDEKMFRGRAMTYYGRWTYKYDIAAEKGAAACLIVHETGPAGYPFAVVGSGAGREQFDLKTPNGNMDKCAVEAWMTFDFSKQLFAAAGQDLMALKAAATRADFRPVPLKATANFSVENKIREVQSKNVVALMPGRSKPGEFIIYTAHWDHLGIDERLQGDQIFNGALDNASGTAVMLELGREFAELPAAEKPERSILFLAVTAEEMGLLGSRHYAENPLYPLNKTVANINMDGANLIAKTRDIEVVGSGATTIEDSAAEVARSQGRILTADTQPEKGFYYRSDHFEFAKVGVPAFYGKAGREALDKPADYIDQKRGAYIANDYHKVSDEIAEDWDFEAAAQDARFLFALGKKLSDASSWPEWKPGSEFKARREASLAR